MSEVEGLFEDPIEISKDEDTPTIEEKTIEKKEEKPKKKRKEMSPEAKKLLLERLAKGRETATQNRKLKSKAKEILKQKRLKEQEEARRIVEEAEVKEKPSSKVITPKLREPTKIPVKYSDDYNILKKELAEIKQLLKNKTISESKKEELKETQKELKLEIKEIKEEKPAPVVKTPPVVKPKEITFSTIRNRKRKNIRRGF